MDPYFLFALALTGSLVGLVSSYFGVGACFIMVPVMIFFFESSNVPSSLAPLLAFGTNMAIVVPTALSGVIRHKRELKRKNLEFPVRHYVFFALPVGLGSILGALFAFVFFTSYRSQAGLFLKMLFGLACLIGAYRFMKARPLPIQELLTPKLHSYAVSGVSSGAFAHFIGIGGGLVYMPVLNSILKIPVHLAVPLSLATMVIGSSVGSVSFGLLGRIDQAANPLSYPPLSFGWFNLLAFLTIGLPSVLFAQLGPRLAHKTPPEKFKLFLAILYVYIGIRLCLNGFCQLKGLPRLLP